MTLYKNVDICDLNAIIKNGILPISETNNNNWSDGKRADNPENVVYLFDPVKNENTFCKYGIALVVVNVNNADLNDMNDNDINKNSYLEYTCGKVCPEQIARIYIPAMFKKRIILSNSVMDLVQWCDISADLYDHYDQDANKSIYKNCDKIIFEQFAKTAPINCSEYNFFRGTYKNNEIFDLYNVKYIF